MAEDPHAPAIVGELKGVRLRTPLHAVAALAALACARGGLARSGTRVAALLVPEVWDASPRSVSIALAPASDESVVGVRGVVYVRLEVSVSGRSDNVVVCSVTRNGTEIACMQLELDGCVRAAQLGTPENAFINVDAVVAFIVSKLVRPALDELADCMPPSAESQATQMRPQDEDTRRAAEQAAGSSSSGVPRPPRASGPDVARDPLLVPPVGRGWPAQPSPLSVGDDDLIPGGLPRLSPGGGMLMGPGHPIFGGGGIGGVPAPGFGRGGPGVPGLPPGVPPGARFDPYGPPGLPGFGQRPGPRGPGGRRNYGDEMPPPDDNDSMYM